MEKSFSIMKNDILGKNYSLSIACVDEETSRKINKKYRQKDRPTNILSFPLRRDMGEIVLCPATIKREREKFGRTFDELLGFLVIHGMLHLKGYEHSSTMEALEKKYDQKYFGGDRRGIVRDASRSRRILKRRKKS